MSISGSGCWGNSHRGRYHYSLCIGLCSDSSCRLCRSVVVAVRGTATMEDVITDSVAAPDLLDRSEWLPESFKQQQAQTGSSMLTAS